jgi:hypothetical protein
MSNAITQLIATHSNRNKVDSPLQMLSGIQRHKANEMSLESQQNKMASDKRIEGLKFAANVGSQLKSIRDPQQKAEVYSTARRLAEMNGHDISAFPDQYSPQAEGMLEIAYQQIYQPEIIRERMMSAEPYSDLGRLTADRNRILESGGDVSFFDELIKSREGAGGQPSLTASQKDFNTYQELLKTDPEQAKLFGRQAGFVSKEGMKLSSHMEKRLSQASDQSVRSGNSLRRLNDLSQQFLNVDVGGGLFGSSWPEKMKELTGKQDAVTELRRAYQEIRSSQAIDNLPPGVASDKDIELALSGFPPKDANGQYISQFLTGLSKMEKARKEFSEFKVNYISENGTERGMLDKWKARSNSTTQAPPKAIEHLKNNPELADQFEAKYGYLPEDF